MPASLVSTLQAAHPSIRFVKSDSFYWSPKDQTVYFAGITSESDAWTLLHELSHGLLGHSGYTLDMELVKLELAAWQKANELGAAYGIAIDQNYIEDCLDTYRSWLHKRSLCPSCLLESPQTSEKAYECLNCGQTWQVSMSRLCRPYRALKRGIKEKATALER